MIHKYDPKRWGTMKMKKLLPSIISAGMLLFGGVANATYTVIDLGDLGGGFSVAGSINEIGQIFGDTKTSNGESVHFIWDSIHGMQIYTGNIADIKQVNDSGQRLGSALHNGYLTANIDGTWLAMPESFQSSSGAGLNNLGEAVGSASLSAEPHLHIATYWPSINKVTVLGTLGGNQSYANDINDAGVIVGESTTYAGATYGRAFIYDSVNRMQNLNDLVLPGHGFDFFNAAGGINNAGLIAATGRINGTWHAVLMTPSSTSPVPIPPSILLFASGLIGLAGVRRMFKK